MNRLFASSLLAVSIAMTLSACGPTEEERRAAEAEQAAAAQEAQAQEQLRLYEEARADGQWEVAHSLAIFIQQNFPDSPAARQVEQTQEEVAQRSELIRERRRLEGLWVYHEVEEEGEVTRTAYAYSDDDASTAQQVRLVLRSHPEWGESIYLLPEAATPRFACANPCNISVQFDGEAVEFEAMVSEPTENHAMFIENGERFIEGMAEADVVAIHAEDEDGEAIVLSYEVGGFVPGRFAGDAAEPAAE